MNIKQALTNIAEQVMQMGDDNLPILLNGAAHEIEQLQQRNDELAAQVELLRKMAYEKQAVMLTKYGLDGAACKRVYALLQDLTPAQCLAEIKAQAVEDAVKATASDKYGLPLRNACDLYEYANTIRNQKG